MNRDDRAQLCALGARYAPPVFEGVDAETLKDDELIDLLEQGFQSCGVLEEAVEPCDAVDADVLAERFEVAGLRVQERRMRLVDPDGRTIKERPEGHGRFRREYTAATRAATLDDVMGARMGDDGVLVIVLADGQRYRLGPDSGADE